MDGELLWRDDTKKQNWWSEWKQRRGGTIYRNIKEGDETKTWERFAILPNVKDQKYTLGNKFTSREDQGEFIYLSPHYLSANYPTGNRVCEINVENMKYFVTPIAKGPTVFINERKIVKTTELKFDDKLSLWKISNFFLFKERELNPEALTYSDEYLKALYRKPGKRRGTKNKGGIFPGTNGLILSHILSFLPTHELKPARLVSRMWNEEAFKILKKRCTLTFDYQMGYDNAHQSMRIFRYSIEMKNNGIQNWKIDLPGIGKSTDDYPMLDSSPGQVGAKLLEDLKWFILDQNPKVHKIKRLELGGTVQYKSDFEFRIKLLQALAKDLEEFTLSGNWILYSTSAYDLSFPEDIQCKKLRVFTLNPNYLIPEFTYFSIHSWFQQLIKVLRGVTTLRLECTPLLSSPFLNFMVENDSWKMFSNLNEIRVLHLNDDVIQALLKLNNPLKKLELYGLNDMTNEDFLAFDRLLLKHSRTLERLQFIIPKIPSRETGVIINFPAFPNLNHLTVGLSNRHQSNVKHVKLAFPDGDINYKNDLPCLKVLALFPTLYNHPPLERSGCRWTEISPLYERFFPGIVQGYCGELPICKSLKRLDIINQSKSWNRHYSGASKPLETVIAKMFPNAENDWIKSVREGIEKTPKQNSSL